MINNDNTFSITSYGETLQVKVELDRYTNGRVCVSLLYFDEEMQGWFPHCKLTVNMPDVHLNEGEVLIKDWAENAPIVEDLVARGFIRPTGREVSSGFVFPMVATINGEGPTS
jgi:hypothetical protein